MHIQIGLDSKSGEQMGKRSKRIEKDVWRSTDSAGSGGILSIFHR